MKYLRILLCVVAVVFMVTVFSSCDDDSESNRPDVTISVSYGEEVSVVDNDVYLVQGNDLQITGVYVRANRPGKTATMGPVTYAFNGITVGYNPVAPFGITVPTASLSPGRYLLTIGMTVAEVHCELAQAYAPIEVNIVSSQDDIPSDADNADGSLYPVRINLQ